MDSGVGSDGDEEKRTRTKEQKQRHNEQRQLIANCFIDATSLGDEEDDQSSIPNYSMLQTHHMRSQEDGATALDEDPVTPHNSIVQINDGVGGKKMLPVGFYVDLNEVGEAASSEEQPKTGAKKNIFSMIIDFDEPKRDMPSRFSERRRSSHSSRLTNGSQSNNHSRNHSASKSSRSGCVSSVDSDSEAPVRRNRLMASTEHAMSSSGHDSDSVDTEGETVTNSLSAKLASHGFGDKGATDGIHNKKTVNDNKSEEVSGSKQQFVKLSDMQTQAPRVDLFVSTRMSRSIPERSWVESPLAMSQSAGYRTAPKPLELDEVVEDKSSDEKSPPTQPQRCVQKLGTDLLRMFLEEIGTDVTVEVGSRHFRAHKCILASRCQYFAAVLGGPLENDTIPVQGYSYAVVHFALCHIYSGAAHVPESISLVELAALADMLALEGLKEVVGHALTVRHCHNFHEPCTGCISGVVEVLAMSAVYGLDDQYQSCLDWIRTHFVCVWPSRAFGSLPKDLREKCRQQIVIHLSSDSVLETYSKCDRLLGSLPSGKWAEAVAHLVRQVSDACGVYLKQHFDAVLNSPSLLLLEERRVQRASRQLVDFVLFSAETVGPEQACRCYLRCQKMLEKTWTVWFTNFLVKLREALEKCVAKQVSQACLCKSWMQLEPSTRMRIRQAAGGKCRSPNASRLPVSKSGSRSVTTTPSSSTPSSPRSPTLSSSDSQIRKSPSLRRSLLAAAHSPSSPLPSRRAGSSTLTRPTQSSAAKSASNANATKSTGPVVAARSAGAAKSGPKKGTTATVSARKPALAQSKSPVKKPLTNITKTSTSTKKNPPKKEVVTNSKKPNADQPQPAKHSPVLQRSGTFLKSEPTIIGKLQ